MKQEKKVGLVSRAAEAAKKEALDIPENIGNLPENTIGAAARYLIKKFGPEKAAKMIERLEKTAEELPSSQLGEVGKKTGFIKNIPKAETYKEKVVENLGKGFVDILLGGGALKTLSSLPKAITSIGGLLAQSFAQPKIEKAFPNSPLLQTGANIASGIGGAVLGSKLSKTITKPKNIELPKGTAGQLAPLGSERSDKLLAKQLDLSKKDYKSAKLLQNIQKKQHQEIIDKLTPKDKTKGSEIVKAIDESFENMKKIRREQYQTAKDEIFNNYQGEAPDLTKTFDLIDKITSEASQGGKIAKALGDINNKIHRNKGSLINLNSTKSDIQSLTQGFGKTELHLSDQQAALINMAAHQLEQDIEKSVPQIGKMNAIYKTQSDQLQNLQKGVVGKSVKAAANKPSEIFKRIFEKTDPEKIDEFKSVIPQDLYEKAAEQYLGDVLQKSLGQPSRNQQNLSNKFYNIRSSLEKNKDQLSATLPEKYKNIMDETIEKIQVSERGVPRNDFTIQSNRNVAVGDEAKGLGVAKNYLGKSIPSLIGAGAGYVVGGPYGALTGAAVGTGASQIGNAIKTKALRKEMLTGLSPTEQVGQSISNATPQLAQQTMIGKSLTKSNDPSSQQLENKQDPLKEQIHQPEIDQQVQNSGQEREEYDPEKDIDDYFQSLSSNKRIEETENDGYNAESDIDDYFRSLVKKK